MCRLKGVRITGWIKLFSNYFQNSNFVTIKSSQRLVILRPRNDIREKYIFMHSLSHDSKYNPLGKWETQNMKKEHIGRMYEVSDAIISLSLTHNLSTLCWFGIHPGKQLPLIDNWLIINN